MQVEEFVRKLGNVEEFTYEKGMLSGLEAAATTEKSEREALVEALISSFWKLPKARSQELWIEELLDRIQERSDSSEFLKQMVQDLGKVWGKLGIRRIEKFTVLLKRLMDAIVKEEMPVLEEYLKKGPDAKYDLVVIGEVLNFYRELTVKQMDSLLMYLIDTKNSYFRRFFTKRALPKMKQQGVPDALREKAFAIAKDESTDDSLRKILYEVAKANGMDGQ